MIWYINFKKSGRQLRMQYCNCLYYCKSFDSQTVVEAKFNRADCGKFKKGVAIL